MSQGQVVRYWFEVKDPSAEAELINFNNLAGLEVMLGQTWFKNVANIGLTWS